MKFFLCLLPLLLAASASVAVVTAFTIPTTTTRPNNNNNNNNKAAAIVSQSPPIPDVSSRADFMKNAAVMTTTGAATIILAAVAAPEPAFARGRATIEYTYDRYTPRILAGGQFYAKDLRTLIGNNDWAGIQAALQEPPSTKRTADDKKKADGGIAERAAQAGRFSDARVLAACGLFAAGFSDNSFSAKTKKMKGEVEVLGTIVEEMRSTARQALMMVGDESGGGGKILSSSSNNKKGELENKMRELYVEGGSTWNKYIFAANEELPLQFKKLPYL
jgi:hypothetical protein